MWFGVTVVMLVMLVAVVALVAVVMLVAVVTVVTRQRCGRDEDNKPYRWKSAGDGCSLSLCRERERQMFRAQSVPTALRFFQSVAGTSGKAWLASLPAFEQNEKSFDFPLALSPCIEFYGYKIASQ